MSDIERELIASPTSAAIRLGRHKVRELLDSLFVGFRGTLVFWHTPTRKMHALWEQKARASEPLPWVIDGQHVSRRYTP